MRVGRTPTPGQASSEPPVVAGHPLRCDARPGLHGRQDPPVAELRESFGMRAAQPCPTGSRSRDGS